MDHTPCNIFKIIFMSLGKKKKKTTVLQQPIGILLPHPQPDWIGSGSYGEAKCV